MVRRKLVICAVAATILAAIAALRPNRVATVSAAGSGNLSGPLGLVFFGCPLGAMPTFCDQVPGTSSSPQLVGVVNTTAVTNVTVSLAAIPGLSSNFAAGDFTVTNNTCIGSLAAKQGCSMGVAFTPTTTGLRQAALTVTDGQNDTLTINIEGRGTELALTPPLPGCGGPIPTSYPFCETNVGGASNAATFTISAGAVATGINVTLAPIPGLTSEFSSDDFTITGTTCTGALAAGGSCTVTLEFTPTAAGLFSAMLTATDSNSDTSTVYLSGSTPSGLQFGAANASGPVPCHVVSRDFCNEPQGGTSASYTFVLTNTSGAQITGLAITPPVASNPPPSPPPPPTDFTVQGTTCTAMLAANSSCTITVAFTPQGTGLRQGEVEVTDTQGDVAGLNLAGVGDDYELQFAGGQQQEMTVAQGESVTYKAQVTTESVFGMNGEQVTFACPNNLPGFSTCAITPCPVMVTPNSTTAFSIAIVTTSASKTAPPVSGSCTEAVSVLPVVRGPGKEMRLAPQTASQRWLFPSLALLAAALAAFGLGARTGKRVRWILASAGIAAVIFLGCHKSVAPTDVTPIAVTNMTITGNALDANGNPINASRPLSITLDVVAAP